MITREPMLDMFLFETSEMIDQLQQIMMDSEKAQEISPASINEIFRIMHTIKGSSGMMMFDNISHLAHSVEDMFYFIRESKPEHIDYSALVDIVLESGDLIREETEKINDDLEADTDFTGFIRKVEDFLTELKQENGIDAPYEGNAPVQKEAVKFYVTNDRGNTDQRYFQAAIFFEEKCEMENIRSFTVLHKLKEIAEVVHYEPEDILTDNSSVDIIKQQGFMMYFGTDKSREQLDEFFQDTIFLDHYELIAFADEKAMIQEFSGKEDEPDEAGPEDIILEEIGREEAAQGVASQKEPGDYSRNTVISGETERKDAAIEEAGRKKTGTGENKEHRPEMEAVNTSGKAVHKSSLISVDVHKLDKLMDLVGELVLSESMVTNNPELQGLELDDFYKAVRQHRKRLSDLQDVVMSIRMVSLAPTLGRMNRIVRDMCKKLNKKAELEIIGEDTEVDKNIIEHIGDPLMHIIRNSMDHGIEEEAVRTAQMKNPVGKITIEARNAGGDVIITVRDDGKGLDRDKILQRAIENGIVTGDGRNLSDKEIYTSIFAPGISTKEEVTEFSGRGVGMDVVVKEIEKVRGTVTVDSVYGEGTTVTIKIPLTIAILDGMLVRVGESIFTIPVTSIKQSIIVKNEEVFRDLDDNEMLTIRGECFTILRLHEYYGLKTQVTDIANGIVIMVEEDGKTICLFADELLGEQQVVIKALPEYINKIKGTSGCTLLGDGSISLILDVAQLVNI